MRLDRHLSDVLRRALSLGAALAAGAVLPANAVAQAPAVAITHATVIDVASGRSTANQTVLVEGNRIRAVGSSASLQLPAGARVIDAAGKFVIPGLWDMHVHATGFGIDRLFLPVLAANGITGVRDMFGRVAWYDSARALARRGEIVAPRIVGAGHILDGTPAIWPGSIGVASADEARRAVDSLVDAGAAFIKLYSRLTRDAFLAAADEAKKRGVPFAGHVPSLVSASEASDAGMKSIEHLQTFTAACASDYDAYLAEYASAVASPKGWDSAAVVTRTRARSQPAAYDASRCTALAQRLKKNGTWMVPTIVVLRSIAYLDDSTLAADPRLAYIPRWFSGSWNPKSDFRFRMLTAEDWAARKAIYAEQREIVKLLHRSGVAFMAGTDLSNPYIFPGFSLHEELAHFVALGFTPLEALQSATIAPARYLQATDSLGAVAAGKVADLVVLDANPLTDIRNTQRIFAVVLDGRLIDGAERDALLRAGEKLASGKP
jgi:imidazolonepropionase-like amidohydrolase